MFWGRELGEIARWIPLKCHRRRRHRLLDGRSDADASKRARSRPIPFDLAEMGAPFYQRLARALIRANFSYRISRGIPLESRRLTRRKIAPARRFRRIGRDIVLLARPVIASSFADNLRRCHAVKTIKRAVQFHSKSRQLPKRALKFSPARAYRRKPPRSDGESVSRKRVREKGAG